MVTKAQPKEILLFLEELVLLVNLPSHSNHELELCIFVHRCVCLYPRVASVSCKLLTCVPVSIISMQEHVSPQFLKSTYLHRVGILGGKVSKERTHEVMTRLTVVSYWKMLGSTRKRK